MARSRNNQRSRSSGDVNLRRRRIEAAIREDEREEIAIVRNLVENEDGVMYEPLLDNPLALSFLAF